MQYNIDITELWSYKFNLINTPDGIQTISDIIKKPNKNCNAVLFDSGDIIECSTDHLFQCVDDSWIKSDDLIAGISIKTKYGRAAVVEVMPIGIHDTYDLTVDHPEHRYYSDGIVSHNTGKTSTATALIKEINGEALFINASMENGIDLLRSKITNFASTEAFDSKIKVVVLDEVDNLSQSAQFAFRSLIESFAMNCRFILTGNFKEKMLGPLLDRLENYDFNAFNKAEMIRPMYDRLKFILDNENVTFEPNDLIPIINTYYPSLRSMTGSIQKFSRAGKLQVSQSELDSADEYTKVINAIKTKNFNEMINLVNALTSPDNLYTYLYKNLSQFDKSIHPKVTMTIAKYQFQASSVRDKNLNLAALCAELIQF
jgi:DNA polymerase III delta prime subunit